jgi:inward rectifier potassium channel
VRTTPDEPRDLGFGSVVSRESRQRLLNHDGSFNVVRRRRRLVSALGDYHVLVTLSWPRFLALVTVGFLLVNTLFAAAYVACGPEALAGPAVGSGPGGAWARAFFFSVQTFSTIGYGHVAPVSLAANLLVVAEALCGLFVFALIWGIVFARFARPQARIRFSERAVVAPYRGITGFEFRVANESSSQLVDVRAEVMLGRMEVDAEGRSLRRFYDLPLERDHIAFFPLAWTIVHPIDAASPLAGLSAAELAAADAEFLVIWPAPTRPGPRPCTRARRTNSTRSSGVRASRASSCARRTAGGWASRSIGSRRSSASRTSAEAARRAPSPTRAG